jgi:hypothetical protein
MTSINLRLNHVVRIAKIESLIVRAKKREILLL